MKLTSAEGKVLYGLVCWPEFNDVELAVELGLSRVTVTSVRQRLTKNGLYKTFYVPDFMGAGMELFTTMYGEFSGETVHDKKTFLKEVKAGIKNIFYMIKSGGLHLSFGAAKNYTHLRDHIINHHNLHHKSGYLTDKRHNYVIFPLKHTSMPKYFDYAPLLAQHFGLKHKTVGTTKKTVKMVWKPTKREQTTYTAIVENPTATDQEISDLCGVSRQTVNTLRNKFLKDGLLKPLKIPDMGKLGYQLISFTHMHMNPHKTVEDRSSHTNEILEDVNHVLKVSGDLESIMLSVHKDYSSFKKSHDRLLKTYEGERLLSDKPVVHLYPIEETHHMLEHKYSNIINP